MVTLQISEPCDVETIKEFDSYIPAERLREKLERSPEEVLLIKDGDCKAGVLRWGYLWDYIPYLYFLHVRPELRGRGYAAEALRLWEEKMAEAGFDTALCSIPTDDAAQHFTGRWATARRGLFPFPSALSRSRWRFYSSSGSARSPRTIEAQNGSKANNILKM